MALRLPFLNLFFNTKNLSIIFVILLFSAVSGATHKNISFSSRIYNPDGTPLEAMVKRIGIVKIEEWDKKIYH